MFIKNTPLINFQKIPIQLVNALIKQIFHISLKQTSETKVKSLE
ncbi:hypothetical protein [uncultured Gammaproteobacteria bacterium]|nr:hypothetical protein [uncultured Gammaproteobacteria bacterium]